MSKFTDAVSFFYFNAGSSYMPGRESQVVGQLLGADEMARAEQWARHEGAAFEWIDDNEPADVWNEDTATYDRLPAMVCLMRMRSSCGHMHVVASLGAIVESADWREQMNYRRVIQAELALEALHERTATEDCQDESGSSVAGAGRAS